MEQSLIESEPSITVNDYIVLCKEYNKVHNIVLSNIKPDECPINIFASKINKPCKSVNPGISECPVCGNAMCPICNSHSAEQISRVTGYVGTVSSWNNAKKQELKDRKRYEIPMV